MAWSFLRRRALPIVSVLLIITLALVLRHWRSFAVQFELQRLQRNPELHLVDLNPTRGSVREEALEVFAGTPQGARALLEEVLHELEGWYEALWPEPQALPNVLRGVFAVGREHNQDSGPFRFAYALKTPKRFTRYGQSWKMPERLPQAWRLLTESAGLEITLPWVPELRFTVLRAEEARARCGMDWALAKSSKTFACVIECTSAPAQKSR